MKRLATPLITSVANLAIYCRDYDWVRLQDQPKITNRYKFFTPWHVYRYITQDFWLQAVKIAFGAGCSLAIFAPAWTHEAILDGGGSLIMPEPLNIFGQFMLRDRALWDSLWPFLNTRLPCQLPFQTSFCTGQGMKRWMYGEVILCNNLDDLKLIIIVMLLQRGLGFTTVHLSSFYLCLFKLHGFC